MKYEVGDIVIIRESWGAAIGEVSYVADPYHAQFVLPYDVRLVHPIWGMHLGLRSYNNSELKFYCRAL